MKVFRCVFKHYHPDDCHHDPKKDVRECYVVAETSEEASAIVRPNYGSAWRLNISEPREIEQGMVMPW